jgi:hypothetical protein
MKRSETPSSDQCNSSFPSLGSTFKTHSEGSGSTGQEERKITHLLRTTACHVGMSTGLPSCSSECTRVLPYRQGDQVSKNSVTKVTRAEPRPDPDQSGFAHDTTQPARGGSMKLQAPGDSVVSHRSHEHAK